MTTCLLWTVALLAQAPAASPADLLTVAEKSNYEATASSADVVSLCKRLAEVSPLVHYAEAGKSSEGKPLSLLIVANPPVKTPGEVKQSGKLVALAFGNIHAGEVCGKEALPQLVRELATTPDHPLLKDLVLLVVPDLNPDGNDRFGPDNRPGQKGPKLTGKRANAQGLDLNRDWTKLESPEIRALVRLLNQYDPDLVIDTHTTNGSKHRYTLTYGGPKHPAGSSAIVGYVRDTMLPAVSAALEKATGDKSFYYGNFESDKTEWTSYPAQPRYGTNYQGLRHHLAILSEAYSYAPFPDRVRATKEFVRACLEHAVKNKDEVRRLRREAKSATTAAGRSPKPDDQLPIRTEAKAGGKPVTILGYESVDGSDRPKDYTLRWIDEQVATKSVQRPYGYVIPPTFPAVVETLQRHGLELEELREDVEVEVEVARVEQIETDPSPYQKHRLQDLKTASQSRICRLEAGSHLVKTAQPLGTLAVELLEAEAEDGLGTWNAFDQVLSPGADYPVVRLVEPVQLLTQPARRLPEDRPAPKPITFETARGAGPGGFGGFNTMTWLEDGDHYLQAKDGRLHKVDAVSGRSEPFIDTDKLAAALAKVPSLNQRSAGEMARRPNLTMDPQYQGAVWTSENDLYHARLDGSQAVRLTTTPQSEEVPTFSPDGKFVAFVRDDDLWVVDVATQTERALTRDGEGRILNAKASYIYYEEVFNRDRRAYWWSPDSRRIAFLKFDDRPVPELPVFDSVAFKPSERPAYPRSGETNPTVRLGIVPPDGGEPTLVELPDYPAASILIMRVYFRPDGSSAIAYVQDRAQTWLDLVEVPLPPGSGPPKRLHRETTKAWVETLESPWFLKDGSFLLLSERGGWRHLERFAKDGTSLGPVTKGDWAINSVLRVDEESGWVFFNARKDNPIGLDLYRIKLDGSELGRLTLLDGGHQADVSPNGRWFIDRVSSRTAPTKTFLRSVEEGGPIARTIDAAPSRPKILDDYDWLPRQALRIPAADGFVLEAELVEPPDVDPSKKYPVYVTTYGGPRAPTISDSWSGGRMSDQALAREGFLVFRIDPRSASDKSAASAWSAYKQLGVSELKDIEDAVRWLLKEKPHADADRVGIEGSSYGGYVVCFALTHSKLFAAGIAQAPVTDWHDYDSIYTERYMGTPQDNPEGYDKTSAVKAARNIHGKLLLMHGGRDHNVPVQNTMKLAQALQQAGKEFELMIYPTAAHGGFGAHGRNLAHDFLKRTLGGPKPRPSSH